MPQLAKAGMAFKILVDIEPRVQHPLKAMLRKGYGGGRKTQMARGYATDTFISNKRRLVLLMTHSDLNRGTWNKRRTQNL